jgi:hypothetical protein
MFKRAMMAATARFWEGRRTWITGASAGIGAGA